MDSRKVAARQAVSEASEELAARVVAEVAEAGEASSCTGELTRGVVFEPIDAPSGPYDGNASDVEVEDIPDESRFSLRSGMDTVGALIDR